MEKLIKEYEEKLAFKEKVYLDFPNICLKIEIELLKEIIKSLIILQNPDK